MSNREFIQYELDEINKNEELARAIWSKAREEKRDTTPEEDEQVDRILADTAKREKRRAELERMDVRSAEAEAVRARIGDPADEDSGEPDGETERDSTRKVVEMLLEGQRAYHDGKGGEIGWDSPAYTREEQRAIADFSDSGSLYTSDFRTQVAIYERTFSPWLQIANVISATNGRPLIVPNLSADATTYTPGEGTAITESTPTLGTATVTLTSYKALSYISMEADEDAMYELTPVISYSHGRQLGLDIGSAVTVTVLAGAANGGTAGGLGGGSTATFIGYEDLLTLKYGRAAPYRQRGVWLMANGLIVKARKWTDKNGQYLWQNAIAAGQPPTFDGDAVYEDPFLATPASATKSVLYGDPKVVVIKQVPLRFAVSTEFRFATDQLALKSVHRGAGAVADSAGLAYMVSANT